LYLLLSEQRKNYCIKLDQDPVWPRKLTKLFLMTLYDIKGDMSESVTNYNYVGNTKVSVSIKKTNANKCTLSEIFLTEILKSFSEF